MDKELEMLTLFSDFPQLCHQRQLITGSVAKQELEWRSYTTMKINLIGRHLTYKSIIHLLKT